MGDNREKQDERKQAWQGLSVELILTPKLAVPPGHQALLTAVVLAELEYPIHHLQVWPQELVAVVIPYLDTTLQELATAKSQVEWKLTETIAEIAGLRWPLEFACDPDDEPRREDADEIIMSHSLTKWERFKFQAGRAPETTPDGETVH